MPFAIPKTVSGWPTVSPMVLRGFSEPYGFWKMYWICRRDSVLRDRADVSSSLSPSRMLPVQSRCSPAIERAVVVLPEPDSPTTARHSWCSSVRLIECSTSILP